MKYFAPQEFKCPNDGYECMDAGLLNKLASAREIARIPFHINSAFRTPEQNEEVGGVKNSPHLRGTAVDIRVRNSRERLLVLRACIRAGFDRIGVGKTFIHVDTDTSKVPEVVWLYEE